MRLPGAPVEVQEEIARVVRALADGHPAVADVVLLHEDAPGAGAIRSRLGASFDDFLYAHDATGTVCRRLARAYPGARPVCIGDAFGMVYAPGFAESYRRRASPLRRARSWLRALGEPPPVRARVAALVLPVDPSGHGLDGVELACCPKAAFADAIRACQERAASLDAHVRDLLASTAGRPRTLLLTENYAESGHVAADREAGMYAEILERHCEPDSVVIVKPHPLESPGKLERLRAAAAGRWTILPTDPAFARYPIEVWTGLVRACRVICAGYPALSLKYAHDVDVLQPLDAAFVERWMVPEWRRWTLDSLQLYMEPLRRLAAWDGRSVLWTARVNP